MKTKLLNSMRVLLVAALLGVGASNVQADDKAVLNPTGTAQLDLETNSTSATSWNANQSSVRGSGDYIGTFTANKVVITKFDASSTLEGKSLVKAELKFHSVCTTSGKNSTLWAAVLNNVSWAVTDVSNGNINVKNFADSEKTAEIQNVGSAGADVTLDVTSWLYSDDDKIIGFGIYTYTGREQQITNLTLEVTYSSEVFYTASFTENNDLTPTVTIYSDEDRTSPVLNGTLADATTYYYRAVYEGYTDYDGLFTVASANPSISFTMTAKPRYTFTVNAVNSVGGTILQTFYTDDNSYDGKKHYVSFPAYITDGDNAVLYSKDNETYYPSFTSSSAEATQTQSYTSYTGDAWFFEGENIEGATEYTTSTYRGRTSGGSTGVLNAKTISSLDAGNYKITARVIGKAGNTCSMYKTSTEGEKIFDVTTKTTGATGVGYITLDATTAIVANGGWYTSSDNGYGFDYILIEKVATVSKSITSAGWATYCSPYILDFSSAIANLDAAYIVTGGAGGVLTKTEVTGAVPAGTGLLLKGNGECVIPVAATSTFDVTGNKLEGKTAAYELAANGGYVLMNDATNGLGFYQNSNIFTVGANTAYLPFGFDGGSARSFFSFGSDATGIGSAKSEEIKDKSEVYNLKGLRVSQPTKGLYIVNGKKVVIK